MKFSIFNKFGALNSPPVFEAFAQGLTKHGHQVVEHDMTADVAVIWSVLWNGRMRPAQQVYAKFRELRKPVVVLEIGCLDRDRTWKIGVDGVNTGHFDWSKDYHRPFSKRIEVESAKISGNDVVICTQNPMSEQWRNQPITAKWIEQTINTIRKYTDRPIVVRPHPRQRISDIPGCVIEMPRPIQGTYDSFDYDRCLSTAWAVVNHNSGPGSLAVLNGVPAFVHASSLAAPVGNTDLSAINNPSKPDRTAWLERLAHTEWYTEEIASGLPLRRLLLA